jgi:hypothetical protein
MSDVVAFFRHNFHVILEASSSPDMGAMLGGVWTETIMSFITLAYKRYQANKEKRRFE